MGSSNDNVNSAASITAAVTAGLQAIRGTSPLWVASTAYTVGQIARNGTSLYIVTTAGTSASSGGPTGVNPSITDGTVTWSYMMPVGTTSSAPIIVYGAWSVNANCNTTEAAIKAGVNAFSDPLSNTFFVPICYDSASPWIIGSYNNNPTPFGQTGLTTVSNFTTYVNTSDNTHPPDLGAEHCAQMKDLSYRTLVLPLVK